MDFKFIRDTNANSNCRNYAYCNTHCNGYCNVYSYCHSDGNCHSYSHRYSPADGDHSNGAGFHFFAGENAMGEIRRGVVAFDIAGAIPPGSTITAVSLSMNMSMTPTGAVTVELHKLLADWGEGTSHAPMGEGDGAPATPNDATWRHRFFDSVFWTTQGGDFSATVSASQSVAGIGQYTWS